MELIGRLKIILLPSYPTTEKEMNAVSICGSEPSDIRRRRDCCEKPEAPKEIKFNVCLLSGVYLRSTPFDAQHAQSRTRAPLQSRLAHILQMHETTLMQMPRHGEHPNTKYSKTLIVSSEDTVHHRYS